MALAGLAGSCANLAQPDHNIWPALILGITALVLIIDCAPRPDAAARAGWAFGFGYFLPGLYWIGEAFLVEAETFGWMRPFAVTLLPAGLALFYAAAGALAGAFWRPGPWRIVIFAAAFTLAELARGHVLTGFPWNTLGYGLATDDRLLQIVSLTGTYGLTVLALVIAAAPATLFSSGRMVARLTPPALAALALAAAWAWGDARLDMNKTEFVPNVTIRIVQPSIPQADKWRPEMREATLRSYLALSQSAPSAPNPLRPGMVLVWPEVAIPFLVHESPEALEAIDAVLPEGVPLVLGAIRLDRLGFDPARQERPDAYNSMFVMDDRAAIIGRYDKHHLVPFGEYLPMQGLLEAIGLSQLTKMRGGFASGAGPRRLEIPGLPPASPLICYEIIFPGRVAGDGTPKPSWMLNLTNDAWFGTSAGPYQHLLQARIRAVEEGLPVVRSANNGVSAVIDAYGRIVAQIPLNAVDAMDVALPRPINRPYRLQQE